MSVAYTSGRAPSPGMDPGTARRTLRAEKAQLLRWRRLLQARLDLAVAAFAPPEALGQQTWGLLSPTPPPPPTAHELIEAVTVRPHEDTVALMERLRVLDDRLAAYGAEVDTALERATQDLVVHLAAVRRSRGDGPDDAR